jgi:hypothetical protein
MATASNEQSQPGGPHPSDSSTLSHNAAMDDTSPPRSTKGPLLHFIYFSAGRHRRLIHVSFWHHDQTLNLAVNQCDFTVTRNTPRSNMKLILRIYASSLSLA